MLPRVCAVLLVVIGAQSLVAEELIPDPQLNAVIRQVLKKKQIEKEQIDPQDLKTIFFLDARKQGIKSLAGLEHCTNLAEVKLGNNEIADISPLAALKNVQSLSLDHNHVSSLQPLAELTKLQYLELSSNQIQSLTGLESLTNLRSLYLSDNQVRDLAPLASLKQLRSIYLNGNQVESLEPLRELKWVATLALKGNRIADLSPVSGFTELRFTFLEDNPLTNFSVLVQMAQADAAGPKRFAPYWFLYVDDQNLSDEAKAQLESLKQIGVRVNRK